MQLVILCTDIQAIPFNCIGYTHAIIVNLDFCDGLRLQETVAGLSSKEIFLEVMSTMYCGCRVVDGSVNIIRRLDETYSSTDFEFLSSVEEIGDTLNIQNINVTDNITLPNLRLIRGHNLLTVLFPLITNPALFIFNVTAPVYLPKLTEITLGDVYIMTVSSCNHRGVLWEDILTDPNSQYQDIGNDHCPSKSSLYITVYGVMIFSFRQYRHYC